MRAEWKKPVYAVFLIMIISLVYMYISAERGITGMAVDEIGNSMQKITGDATETQIKAELAKISSDTNTITINDENFNVKSLGLTENQPNYQVTDTNGNIIGVFQVQTVSNSNTASTGNNPSSGSTADPQTQQSLLNSISTIPYNHIVKNGESTTTYMTHDDINYYIANSVDIALADTGNGYELYNKKTGMPYKQVEYQSNDQNHHISRITENYQLNPFSANVNDAVPTVTKDGSGHTIATATVTQDSITMIKYPGDNIITETTTKTGDNDYTKTVYTQECTSNAPCTTTRQVGKGRSPNEIHMDSSNLITIDKTSDILKRSTTMQTISSDLQNDYGLSGAHVSPDGTASYGTGAYTIRVIPNEKTGDDTVAITINNNKFTYKPKKGFFGSDRFYIGDKRYTLSDSCGSSGDYCLKSGKETFKLNEQQYKAFTDAGKFSKTSKELYNAKYGHSRPDVQKKMDIYYNQIEAKTRSKISQILNAYISDILGPFSYGVPAGICGDRMYKKETTYKNKISGLPVPSSSWQSEMEKDILENTRTVVVFGKVVPLTESMYRYEVTLKLIGDETTGKWELYLHNSCDNADSKDFWKEYGTISNKAVFQMMYAGQDGEDMVFECGVDDYCKFDQACLKLDDEQSPRCFRLAGDIASLCH